VLGQNNYLINKHLHINEQITIIAAAV